jgi:Immunity protein Imm1
VNITLQTRTFNPRSLCGEDVWDETITPSPEALDAALRRLNGDTTTTLVLEHHGRRLYVGGGPDRFSVLAELGYDDFYDLIGDPSLRGRDSLVLGDQLTPIPKRHLVGSNDAREAALTFLELGTIPLSPRWERQGDFQQE